MILDFNYKDYDCHFYIHNHKHDGICFQCDFDDDIINGYAHSTIIFPKNKQTQKNYCFFNTQTLIEYFTEISRLLGFKLISFTQSRNSYKLQIRCAPNQRYFIYCATYIRYVYEYPFALLLFAAWQNRKNFPELNITQIIQYYIALFFIGRRCHCPGMDGSAFRNINSKCQFNLIRDNFNDERYFYYINSVHGKLCWVFDRFNLKQISQIVRGINFIANKHYVKDKKNICRW